MAEFVREVVCSSMRSATREGEAGRGRRRAKDRVELGGVWGMLFVRGRWVSTSDLRERLGSRCSVVMLMLSVVCGDR